MRRAGGVQSLAISTLTMTFKTCANRTGENTCLPHYSFDSSICRRTMSGHGNFEPCFIIQSLEIYTKFSRVLDYCDPIHPSECI